MNTGLTKRSFASTIAIICLAFGLVGITALSSESAQPKFLYGSLTTGTAKGTVEGPYQLTAVEASNLARREIVLIVDKSSSMANRDCPSDACSSAEDANLTAFEWIAAHLAHPISRWNWCCQQVAGLATQLSTISQDCVSIVLFDSHFDAHEHLRAEQIIRLFQDVHPGGRTKLGPALQSEIAIYNARRWVGVPTKPLLLAVLTDGYTENSTAVRNAIIEATKTLRNPDDITVLLVNVGVEQKGSEIIKELDEDLVKQGARFDIVRRTMFSQIAKNGLARALASASF